MPPKKSSCSTRSTTQFQMYISQLLMKKPDKIKLLLARALMHDEYLRDFSGQVHANECMFSFPDSDWFGVYLLDKNENPVWGEDGAQKMYFKLDYQLNSEGLPVDASIKSNTITFETPDELLVNGEEMKGCVIKPSGKCGNPESKKSKKKKSAVNADDYESDDEETPAAILENLQSAGSSANASKKKMPRDYFEKLGSKSLIIDWMITNMKPGEIFKCIERGSLSAEDVKQAKEILGVNDEGSASDVIQSLTAPEIHGMVRVVTKEQIIASANKIKNKEQKKKAIVSMCKRAGIHKYRYRPGKNGKPGFIIDADDDPADEQDVLEECATKEEKRIKKMLKITSISQSVKGMTKQNLINYQGGNVPIPYSMMTFVRRFFPDPLIKDYQERNGLLYGKIQSGNEDGTLYYYKLGDILGKDLKALDKRVKTELFEYQGGNVPIPYSMKSVVQQLFPPPLIKDYQNRDGELYGKIQSEREGGSVSYYKLGDILGKDLKSLESRIQKGTVSFGKRTFSFGRRKQMRKGLKITFLRKDLRTVTRM
jgi:hypothetical protein